MRLKSSTSINQSGPKVTFLGTASSMPTPYKNTLGILAALDDKVNIILDCG
jgi:ribonuclease BN (tRNA processing enzyme)